MTKCSVCGLKNELYLHKCRCSNFYCSKHLLYEKHNCTEIYLIKKEAHHKNKDDLVKNSQGIKVSYEFL